MVETLTIPCKVIDDQCLSSAKGHEYLQLLTKIQVQKQKRITALIKDCNFSD